MSLDSLFPLLFAAVLVLVVGSFVAKMVRFGGFKAAMFGAPIERTLGEVSGTGGRLMTSLLKVHSLRGDPEHRVGLEFLAKSVASYQMTPLTLSATEARRLAALLTAAAG